MADVKIRRLADWVVATLKLAAFRRMLRRKYGTLADSTEGIGADREARG